MVAHFRTRMRKVDLFDVFLNAQNVVSLACNTNDFQLPRYRQQVRLHQRRHFSIIFYVYFRLKKRLFLEIFHATLNYVSSLPLWWFNENYIFPFYILIALSSTFLTQFPCGHKNKYFFILPWDVVYTLCSGWIRIRPYFKNRPESNHIKTRIEIRPKDLDPDPQHFVIISDIFFVFKSLTLIKCRVVFYIQEV